MKNLELRISKFYESGRDIRAKILEHNSNKIIGYILNREDYGEQLITDFEGFIVAKICIERIGTKGTTIYKLQDRNRVPIKNVGGYSCKRLALKELLLYCKEKQLLTFTP